MKTKILIFSCVLLTIFYLYTYTSTKDKKPIIEQIMNYPMAHVIKRCQKDYGYTAEDMKILERELKRYLVLSIFFKEGEPGNGMYSKDVDNLWHSFILFTKDYSSFCKKYIGRFIHHFPNTKTGRAYPGELKEVSKDFQAFIKNYQEIFEEEAHPIWFLDMCEN
jgi:hypothetical protein